MKVDTNELFMTFKLLKRRYRSSDTREKYRRLDYFNHPFEEGNDIKLIDDVNLSKSLSIESIGTQFSAVEEKSKKANVVERTEVNTKTKKNKPFLYDPGDFSPFDVNVAMN